MSIFRRLIGSAAEWREVPGFNRYEHNREGVVRCKERRVIVRPTPSGTVRLYSSKAGRDACVRLVVVEGAVGFNTFTPSRLAV